MVTSMKSLSVFFACCQQQLLVDDEATCVKDENAGNDADQPVGPPADAPCSAAK